MNRSCACKYYIHEKCFRSWCTHNNNNDDNNDNNDDINNNKIKCLICNSKCKTSITQYKRGDIGLFEMAVYFLYKY